jgi:ubiquitin C-terminal hydrolase
LAYAQICQQEKVNEMVEFPLEGLDIAQYVKSDCKAQGISTKYDLFAVTNHYGSLNGGHYTACGQNIDGSWYDFNDSSVSGSRRV